ncbi:MAG: HAMP domain-containing protein [Azoarcus sp.]|jgi:two-component system osmolarity sensor histidine kinase EnvZ|nr:HAMP domain-containing protein [Azoarcus sp.]
MEAKSPAAESGSRRFPPGRLLPRALLWQTFLLIALLLVLTFAAWGQIFRRYFDEPVHINGVARMVASVVNLTRTALLNADAMRRGDLVAELTALEGIQIFPAEPGEETLPLPDDRIMRLLTTEIRRNLGEHTRFAARWKEIDGFWISFRLGSGDTGEYWIMLPFERIQRSRAPAWLSWGGASLLVAVIGAYLVVSRVGKPLRHLAQAARMVGKGQMPRHLEESGPQEIALVARAFNRMTDSLTRAAADRAFILAGVSHDLRTPLARLRLGIELSGISGDDLAAMIADIQAMDRIVGQFLDYGRGAARESMQTLDLAALAGNIVAPYRLRGARIGFDAPERLPALAHNLSLCRALTNLIDNALRYAGEKQPLDIRVFTEDGMACVEVADRGPGMPPAEIERLRQPFTRLEDARSDTHGAGLGLAIVERIVHAHDGRLDLLPRDGGGLRAIVRIPASPD